MTSRLLDRKFALEMVNRIEAYIRENLHRLTFAEIRELRREISRLMLEYRIVKRLSKYELA